MIKYEILFKNKKKWSESQQKDASEKVIYFPTHTTPYNWSFPNPTTYFPLKNDKDKWKPFQVGGHQGRSWRNLSNVGVSYCILYLMVLLKATLLGIVVHTFNPKAQEVEADGSLSSRPAWSTQWVLVLGQLGLHSETLSW